MIELPRQYSGKERGNGKQYETPNSIHPREKGNYVPTVKLFASLEKGTNAKEIKKVERLAPNPLREEKKSERGCVVRGLASALHATPLEKEWQMRFDQFDESLPPELQQKLEKVGSEKTKNEMIRNYHDKKIGELVRTYAEHDSQLGEAVRGKEFEEYGKLDEEKIRALLESGRKVMITGEMRDQNGEFFPNKDGKKEASRHLVHIRLDKEGNLIAESDSKQRIKLSPDGAYTTFAFAEKGQPSPVEMPSDPYKLSNYHEQKSLFGDWGTNPLWHPMSETNEHLYYQPKTINNAKAIYPNR